MDLNSIKEKVLSTLGKGVDGARDFAEKAADSTKDLAGKVADKAKTGTRIAKLTMEIAGERENMKKAYVEIGKLYYDTHKDAPEGFFIQLCEEVALAERNIAEREAEIAELKASGSDDGDIAVDFEEVVSGEESAAEPAGDSAEDSTEE